MGRKSPAGISKVPVAGLRHTRVAMDGRRGVDARGAGLPAGQIQRPASRRRPNPTAPIASDKAAAPQSQPDKTLRLGAGAYLVIFTAGNYWLAIAGARPGIWLLSLATTSTWITLAHFIRRTPDGIFSLDSLVITPLFRPRATSIARKTNA